MKFFNKHALTLVELLISLAISAILFGIIFFFASSNVIELSNNILYSRMMENTLELQTVLSNFKKDGFSDVSLIPIPVDNLYTGITNPSPNNVIYLKKSDNSEGIIIGIVNTDTKKLHMNYSYANAVIGYRELSSAEVSSINSDLNSVFDIEFFLDKVFNNLRIKDFKGELYNGNDFVNLNYSVIRPLGDDLIGTDFQNILNSDLVIGNYNLIL